MEEGSEGYGPHETEILKLKYNGGGGFEAVG